MDGNQFDRLARSLAAGRSRRSLLRALGAAVGAGVLSAVGLDQGADAAILRRPGDICRKDGDCASGRCGPNDRTGRQRCLCASAADCPVPGDKCLTATCAAGVCGTTTAVTCTALDQCHVAGTCDPRTGVCSNPTQPNGTACEHPDACLAGATCQNGTCTGGTPLAGEGAACATDTDCCAGTCAGGNICCASGVSCSGTCCPTATAVCLRSGCCDGGDVCGGAICCTGTDTCCLGNQGSSGCCAAGTICDTATGQCRPPG